MKKVSIERQRYSCYQNYVVIRFHYVPLLRICSKVMDIYPNKFALDVVPQLK